VSAEGQTPDVDRAEIGGLMARIEALERSNADLERFAAIAAHDLQAPLRVVSGFVQLLQRRYAGQLDAQADDFIARALAGAERMSSLTDALLAHARLGGDAPEAMQDVDTAAVVAELLQSLDPIVDEAGVAVTVGALPFVHGHRVELTQLFQNLLSNALKFVVPESPRIAVGAARDGAFWRFTVQDNGIGIDAEARERIFEPFERLHPADRFPGHGIGLAISKRIVDRHGGEIHAEAAAGGGTIFSFTLPATD
jgi:light-regulated signal transduction histidine kinase (bacteriophytochrome)